MTFSFLRPARRGPVVRGADPRERRRLTPLAVAAAAILCGATALPASSAVAASSAGTASSGGTAASAVGGGSCRPAVTHAGDRAAVQPSTATGCLYPTGAQSQSPSIQVTRAGVLFIAQASGGVLRSTDTGRTWTKIAVPPLANGDQGSLHGYVQVDPRTDRVYYVTSMLVTSCGLAGSVVSWSDDLGATWTGRTVACDTWDWGKLVTGPAPAGNPYPSAVYFLGVGDRIVGGQRFVYRSLDGGRTWVKSHNIASATTEAGVGATAPDGTVYFDYPEFVGFDPDRLKNETYPFHSENLCRQMIAVSEDYGQTWRQQAIPGSQACNLLYGQQRVAVDRAGVVYAVWVDDQDRQLYLVTSRDKARTWSAPVNLTAPGRTYALSHANIIAGAPGHVLIAALETAAAVKKPGDYGLLPVSADYDAVLTESFDASSAHPRFTSADLDAPGNPSITAQQQSNEANAYLGMSPSDEGWAVFAQHSPGFTDSADLTAARITHP